MASFSVQSSSGSGWAHQWESRVEFARSSKVSMAVHNMIGDLFQPMISVRGMASSVSSSYTSVKTRSRLGVSLGLNPMR